MRLPYPSRREVTPLGGLPRYCHPCCGVVILCRDLSGAWRRAHRTFCVPGRSPRNGGRSVLQEGGCWRRAVAVSAGYGLSSAVSANSPRVLSTTPMLPARSPAMVVRRRKSSVHNRQLRLH